MPHSSSFFPRLRLHKCPVWCPSRFIIITTPLALEQSLSLDAFHQSSPFAHATSEHYSPAQHPSME